MTVLSSLGMKIELEVKNLTKLLNMLSQAFPEVEFKRNFHGGN